ncbi:MAG: endolytic transglycosylase MltG [Burkholderiales bacterium]
MLRSLILWGLFVVVVAAGLGAWGSWRLVNQPMVAEGQPMRVTVESGMKFKAVARAIESAGAFPYPRALGFVATWRGQADRIKAGVYEIRPGMTPLELLDRMVRGDSLQDTVTLVEGWTFKQFRATLDAHPSLRHDSLRLSEREILERVGAIETQAEGLFFPDSYRFGVGTSDLVVLRQAYGRMRELLERTWVARSSNIPLDSPYALLTLASIVEKETGKQDDRSAIAAVFVNRLRLGMKLQSDPTVIYGMGSKFDGNLRRTDLETDTPYNSYTRSGLPPSPIAAPGLAALKAVANPSASGALYFVARGDGSSEFSATLEEHNRAVARYQRR